MTKKQQDAPASEVLRPGAYIAVRSAVRLVAKVAQRLQLAQAELEFGTRSRDSESLQAKLIGVVDELRLQVWGILHLLEEGGHALQPHAIGPDCARPRMFETYTGEVVRVQGDRVVVAYEVGDDLVEQTYVRDQFLDRQLPKKGDRLVAYVHVAQVPPAEEAGSSEEVDESGEHDDRPKRRKNVVPLPRTF